MTRRDWLSEHVLRLAADPVIFERGRGYADDGVVDLEEVTDDHVTATVLGGMPYAVDLADEEGVLTWACTCPYAEDGSFCKHLVAAALTANAQDGHPPPSAVPDSRPVGDAELRSWLVGHEHADLVALLMGAASRNLELRRELELAVAADRGLAPDLLGYDADLSAAFGTGGFVGWRDAYDWTSDVGAALERVGELLDAGFADAVVALAERGWSLLDQAYGHVDDSNGELGGIADRLTDLHLAALRSAAVDPAEVAERVLDLALATELDTLRDRLGEYRPALGAGGWQALREAAAAIWAEVPARGPGDDEPDRYGRRLRLVTVMESLAGDDLDTLLEIRARSLAHPSDWVRVIELCAGAGHDDLAVEWGERGLDAFGLDADARLSDALSDVYARSGRLADALGLERNRFRRAPTTGRYQRLRAVAEPLGRWPDERADAHRVVREHVVAVERTTTDAQRRNAWWQPPASLLVALLLEDGEVEAAWSEAVARGCSEALWLALAELRADAHPDDAITVYRRRLDRALEPAKDAAYDEVIDVLGDLGPLYDRAQRAGEFHELLARIRADCKRRRNLMARLDRAGL